MQVSYSPSLFEHKLNASENHMHIYTLYNVCIVALNQHHKQVRRFTRMIEIHSPWPSVRCISAAT